MPEGLSPRARRALEFAVLNLSAQAGSDPLRVWDVCRSALASLVDVNVFYVVAIDPIRRTRTIDYIVHRRRRPEVGVVGNPYGNYGLCPRLVSDSTPYRYGEDGGAVIRAGLAFEDESDSQDAAAVQIYRPDGSIYGAVVVSSLKPNQYGQRAIEVIRWLGQLGYMYRNGDVLDSDAVLDAMELDHSDPTNWMRLVCEHVVTELLVTRKSLEAGELEAANQELGKVIGMIYAAQTKLAETYVDESAVLGALRPKELQLMRALARNEGATNPQLAEKLDMSTANVKKLLASASAKTGAQNRLDLTRIAKKWRL